MGSDAKSSLPDLPELSVLILTLNEAGNIGGVVQGVIAQCQTLNVSHEVVVIDGGSTDSTVAEASAAGARVLPQEGPGYANAFHTGLQALKGRYVLTLDGDGSHPAALVPQLLAAREQADVVVGSRWMAGGSFAGPRIREVLSRLLNTVFQRLLRLPVRDLSSGYRLYRRDVLREHYQSPGFAVLEEVLVRAYIDGFRITEVPLQYQPRGAGCSHARPVKLAFIFLATLWRMWLLRRTANGADYDHRAFDSLNPVQRWWQRSRFKNIRYLMGPYWSAGRVLDVGCGSSRIIQTLKHAVAFDRGMPKLRYLGKTNDQRVCGSAFSLAFQDGVFDCLIHSQLIEHLPMEPRLFDEMRRVLRPGGTLILGTVDFGYWTWPLIERIYDVLMPFAYADEHISHYTLSSLKELLPKHGFKVEEVRDILRGEITIRATRIE